MAVDQTCNHRQADTSAFELGGRVQTLKNAKQLVNVGHVEPGPIIAHEIHRFAAQPPGAEVAIEVIDQNSDDQMDAGDYIRFFAQPVSSLYAKYSDQNVYWLTLSGGSGVPLRMATITAAPAGGPLAADFADTAHHELNQIIWIKAPGEDSIERWFFWTYVQGDEHAGGGQPKAFTITVPDPTSSGTLTILMAGQTETTHEVRVAINGVQQDFSWDGISYYQAAVDDVPLLDGDNTVTLQCLSADGNDSMLKSSTHRVPAILLSKRRLLLHRSRTTTETAEVCFE